MQEQIDAAIERTAKLRKDLDAMVLCESLDVADTIKAQVFAEPSMLQLRRSRILQAVAIFRVSHLQIMDNKLPSNGDFVAG